MNGGHQALPPGAIQSEMHEQAPGCPPGVACTRYIPAIPPMHEWTRLMPRPSALRAPAQLPGGACSIATAAASLLVCWPSLRLAFEWRRVQVPSNKMMWQSVGSSVWRLSAASGVC